MNLKERTQFSYKLIIPDKVEEVIRYLQNKYPSTEWSGVLFTSHTGSFATKDLVITCDAIFPMDLGSAAFTSYKMNEEVMNFMVNNDLLYSDLNLVHSHHNMATNPSGTDTNTLLSEGQDNNNFVSLIVNNKGPYWAAITRKATIKLNCTRTISYEFFGDGPVVEDLPNPEETMIEYFQLNIQRNENLKVDFTDPKFNWIDKRFNEIIASRPPVRTSYYGADYWSGYSSFNRNWNMPQTIQQQSLSRYGDYNREIQSIKNQPKPIKQIEQTLSFVDDNIEIIVPQETIEEIICILATGNILYYTQQKSYDLDLEALFQEYKSDFDTKFKKDLNFEAFKTYADTIIDWCVTYFVDNLDYKLVDPSLQDDMITDDVTLFTAALAQKILDVLENFNTTNEYVEYYIKEFKRMSYIW